MRRYAGQSWVNDLIKDDDPSAILPIAALQLIVKDLKDDASQEGVVSGHIELWEHVRSNIKGLFVGDTSTLPDRGYTFITTLL